MSFANIGSTIATLVQLGISETLAAELRSFLTTSAGELTDHTPDAVGHNAFGGAPASQQCASDAGKARTHVADALKDMAAGLEGYGVIVTDLYRNVKDADDTAEQTFKQQAAKADACIPVSFASAPTGCGLPGSAGEDGD
jgi:hypothetical protein